MSGRQAACMGCHVALLLGNEVLACHGRFFSFFSLLGSCSSQGGWLLLVVVVVVHSAPLQGVQECWTGS